MSNVDLGLVVAAWLTGLAGGSGHCIGMCGGIVGALGLGQQRGWRGFGVLVAANLGRVSSYSFAGAAVGFAGAAAVGGLLGPGGIAAMRGLAAVLIVMIGLQLLFGWRLLSGIETGGARVWRRISPWLGRLMPPRDPVRALGVGALWGWLPCGLVYAELTVAATSGGALAGALLMASFGLGTMVSLSALSALLQALDLARLPRQTSGALLVLFGLWMMAPMLLR
jgi:uncharacterized protein